MCQIVYAGFVSDVAFAVPRTGEKALTTFLIFSVYWKLGSRMTASDVPNIAGLLFIWVTVPAYSAAAYTPVSPDAWWKSACRAGTAMAWFRPEYTHGAENAMSHYAATAGVDGKKHDL